MDKIINIIQDDKTTSIHYKLIYKLEKYILNIDHSNIILHGKKGCGKTSIINLLFNNILEIAEQEIDGDFYMKKYKVYYYFNCNNIHNKGEFIEYLKNISNTKDYSGKNKYIILDSFDSINENIQNCLKVILEKSTNVAKYIIISINVNNIIPAIRSRSVLIRVNEPNVYEKYIYLKRKLIEHNILFNEFLLLNDCGKLSLYNVITKYLTDGGYIDIRKYYINKIIDILYSTFSLNKIRDISQILKELDITNILYYELIDKLIMITTEYKITLIIKEIAYYNHIIQKSYRDIIIIESLIISIYNI